MNNEYMYIVFRLCNTIYYSGTDDYNFKCIRFILSFKEKYKDYLKLSIESFLKNFQIIILNNKTMCIYY